MSDTAQISSSTETFISAVRTTIDALDRWANAGLDFIIEDSAGDALNSLCAIAMSRFPSDSDTAVMELFLSVHDVARHWRAYVEEGDSDEDGLPTREFWLAVKDMTSKVKLAETPAHPPLESVQELWSQLESYPRRCEQIAMIYGHTIGGVWQGPFFDARGSVLNHLVEREAKEPNSVLPKDWVPPSEAEKRRKEAERARMNLQKIKLAIAPKVSRENPVDMLREGQYPDVIATACGVTEQKVRAIALEHGIKINEREEFAEGNLAFADPIAEARGFKPTESQTGVSSLEPEGRPAPLAEISEEQLKALVVEYLSDDPDMTAGTCLRKLSEAGYSCKSNAVRSVLKSARGDK